MEMKNFSRFLKTLSFEAQKTFSDIFDEPVKKFYSDMRKNIKILSQDMQRIKPDKEQLVKLYNDVLENNEKELNDSPFQREMAIN